MSNKINICLDIDETLATDLIPDDYLPYLDRIKKICTNPDRYVYALRDHFLHHGVVELIKALTDIPNVDLYFYSSDEAARNVPFVQALLTKAKDKDYFDRTHQKDRIFSEPDTINLRTLDFEHLDFKKMLLENLGIEKTKVIKEDGSVTYNLNPDHPYFVGKRKKNIHKITTSVENLANTILVDDMPGHVLRGQEKHYISLLPFMPEHLKNTDETKCEDNVFIKTDDFRGVNHIFYLAGLLISAIEKFNSDNQGLTLTRVLSDIQLKLSPDGKLIPNYSEIQHNLDYYKIGLNKLKKYNPKLEFILPSNLQEQLNLKYKLAEIQVNSEYAQNTKMVSTPPSLIHNSLFNCKADSLSACDKMTAGQALQCYLK